MSYYERYPQHYPPYTPPRVSLANILWPIFSLLVAAAVLLWGYGNGLFKNWGLNPAASISNEDTRPRPPVPRGELAADEQATIALYKRCSPSVVHITALTRQTNPFTRNVQHIPKGTGSGFIWSKDGYVVTNFHVIQGASGATVTLADHTSHKAQLVGAYPDKDLAVLRIDVPPAGLTPIDVGTSEDLQVGQKVFAIGNPFGLDQTLTTGIVSALNREIESVTGRPIQGVVQTDAAINPGNSGGPLLDSYGRLIGVNTAIASPNGASAGIGFAIPVEEVNRVVPALIANAGRSL